MAVLCHIPIQLVLPLFLILLDCRRSCIYALSSITPADNRHCFYWPAPGFHQYMQCDEQSADIHVSPGECIVFTGELIAITTVLCWTLSVQFFGAASKMAGAVPVNIIRIGIALLLFSLFLWCRDKSTTSGVPFGTEIGYCEPVGA